QPQLYSLYESPSRPMFATTEAKRLLREAISELHGEGGTNHLAALQMALRLHPDVIYLMTDGEPNDDLTPAQLEELPRQIEVNRPTRTLGASINTRADAAMPMSKNKKPLAKISLGFLRSATGLFLGN